MSAYTEFQQFVTDLEASSTYASWCSANPGDCDTWGTYRTAVLTVSPAPGRPSMSTSFGDAIVDVAVIAIENGLVPPAPPGVFGARSLPVGPFVEQASPIVQHTGSDGTGPFGMFSKLHFPEFVEETNGLEISQFQPPSAVPTGFWTVSDIATDRIGNDPPTSDGTSEAGIWLGVPVNANRIQGNGTEMGIWLGGQSKGSTLTDVIAAVLNPDDSLSPVLNTGIYIEHIARNCLIQYATIRAHAHGINAEEWRTDPTNAPFIAAEFPGQAPAGKAGPCVIEIAYCDIQSDTVGIFLDAGVCGFNIHHCKITAPIGINNTTNLAMPAYPNIIDLGSIEFDCTTDVFENTNPIGP